jgi:hypothetical protein
MRQYGYDELVNAFVQLDRVATAPRRVVVFGGAAIALHTRTATGTKDIDHDPPSLDELVNECAARDIELPPFSAVTIAEYPYHYEDRLVRVLPDLAKLEVYVLEPHDLALSKVVRWYEGDETDGCTPSSDSIVPRWSVGSRSR